MTLRGKQKKALWGIRMQKSEMSFEEVLKEWMKPTTSALRREIELILKEKGDIDNWIKVYREARNGSLLARMADKNLSVLVLNVENIRLIIPIIYLADKFEGSTSLSNAIQKLRYLAILMGKIKQIDELISLMHKDAQEIKDELMMKIVNELLENELTRAIE